MDDLSFVLFFSLHSAPSKPSSFQGAKIDLDVNIFTPAQIPKIHKPLGQEPPPIHCACVPAYFETVLLSYTNCFRFPDGNILAATTTVS